MTVAELIEKLQRCPADAEVFVSDSEWGHEEADSAYLVDAFLGPIYRGQKRKVTTHYYWGTNLPNCKAVVISRFYENGERL